MHLFLQNEGLNWEFHRNQSVLKLWARHELLPFLLVPLAVLRMEIDFWLWTGYKLHPDSSGNSQALFMHIKSLYFCGPEDFMAGWEDPGYCAAFVLCFQIWGPSLNLLSVYCFKSELQISEHLKGFLHRQPHIYSLAIPSRFDQHTPRSCDLAWEAVDHQTNGHMCRTNILTGGLKKNTKSCWNNWLWLVFLSQIGFHQSG